MPSSGVRLARISDSDDIAGVNARSWHHRFTDLLPADVLAGLDESDLALTWASGILNPPTPRHRLLVAVDDDRVVGYAAIGPGQDPDAEASTSELIALEVDPERLGQGHGSRLIAAAVDHVRAGGSSEMVVWCPLKDEARRLYLQSAGWGPDSAYRDVGVGPDSVVREVRLVASVE